MPRDSDSHGDSEEKGDEGSMTPEKSTIHEHSARAREVDGNVPAPTGQTSAREEGSGELETSKFVRLDDVFAGLQRFKEEDGDLSVVPVSHSSVIRFIDELSSREVEPLVRRSRIRSRRDLTSSGINYSSPPAIRESTGDYDEGRTHSSGGQSHGGSLDASSSSESLDLDGSWNESPPRGTADEGHPIKERASAGGANNYVGAVQVDEQAPHLNRLFYRNNRRSVLARRRARRVARRREENVSESMAVEARRQGAFVQCRGAARGEDSAGGASPSANAMHGEETSAAPRSAPAFVSGRILHDSRREGGEAPNAIATHGIETNVATQEEELSAVLRSASTFASGRILRDSQRGEGGDAVPNAPATLSRAQTSDFLRRMYTQLVEAILVEDAEGEVFEAQRVGFIERKWKPLALIMCVLLSLLAVGLSLSLTYAIGNQGEVVLEKTIQPSLSPTFDPRPILEVVQTRGHVRCGLWNATIHSGAGFHLDLCRSVAAVLFGDPDRFEGIPATWSDRWQLLHDRKIDLLALGDSYTIEREVREASTGSGFTFSSVYNYDGMVYIGYQTFVLCAEKQRRYDECSSLSICVIVGSSHIDFLTTAFPSRFIIAASTLEDQTEMLFDGLCNVGAYDKSSIHIDALLAEGIRERKFAVGDRMMTKEPLAMVTRNDDREFSDIVNWVVQALFYGEEQGLTKDPKLCKSYANSTLYSASDLDFMNVVHCIGNYGDIFDGDPNDRGMNRINNGTGMLYAIPFGNLDMDAITGLSASGTLSKIREAGSLICGVVTPDGLEGNVTESGGLIGMGVEYCRALAASLLDGDPKDVVFLTFQESILGSYAALANGELDVLVGVDVQREFDFGTSFSSSGFHFSTPYYYGNESPGHGMKMYSMATREDDALFASFVNSIIMATVYAQENRITKDEMFRLPVVSVFGSDLDWALRDAILYSGGYDQIYSRNFGSNVFGAFRGRNALNEGGPMMHSLPHLPSIVVG